MNRVFHLSRGHLTDCIIICKGWNFPRSLYLCRRCWEHQLVCVKGNKCNTADNESSPAVESERESRLAHKSVGSPDRAQPNTTANPGHLPDLSLLAHPNTWTPSFNTRGYTSILTLVIIQSHLISPEWAVNCPKLWELEVSWSHTTRVVRSLVKAWVIVTLHNNQNSQMLLWWIKRIFQVTNMMDRKQLPYLYDRVQWTKRCQISLTPLH